MESFPRGVASVRSSLAISRAMALALSSAKVLSPVFRLFLCFFPPSMVENQIELEPGRS